jgi:hypothetical protein
VTGPRFLAVLAGLLLVAFLVTGTILTIGLFVIPVLLLGILLYGGWHRRRRLRPTPSAPEVTPTEGRR